MKPKHWDRFDIQRGLRERGTNLHRVAIAAGIDPSACKHAVARKKLGGEIAIAKALDIDPAEIWPERYREPLSQARSNALEAFRASRKSRDPSVERISA